MEPENRTYSLSRAQFFLWLVVVGFSYAYLFFAQHSVRGNWAFPGFGGGGYALMISLGTLVGASILSSTVGSKGSGDVYPAMSDLVLHGGVLAPERVQQLVWTVIASISFLFIVIGSYGTDTGMPSIPNELLVLMGVSSAGYLAGKMARDPGPIIDRINPRCDPEQKLLKLSARNCRSIRRVMINGVGESQHRLRHLRTTRIILPTSPRGLLSRLSNTVEKSTIQPLWEIVVIKSPTSRRRNLMSKPKIVGVPQFDQTNLVVNAKFVGSNAKWKINGNTNAEAQQSGRYKR